MNNDLFIFEPDYNEMELEPTYEARSYVRRGPSPHIKNTVIPLLIKHQDGKWVLHYVTPDKAKAHIQRGTGIDYISMIGSYLKPYTINDPRLERLVGKHFTSSYAFLSGLVYSHINKEVANGARWEDKNIVIDKLNENGINEVELADGTKFKSRFLVNLDENRIKLETIGRLKDGTQIRSNLEAKVTHDQFGRRELNIDRLEGYDTDSIGMMTALMQFKYRVIRVRTDILNDRNLANFILNGYGANIEATPELLRMVKEHLENNGLLDRVPAAKSILSEARNLSDIMNAVVKTGIVSPGSPLMQKIVQYVRKLNPEHLEFHSTDWSGRVRYTSSQLALHGTILQRAVDNDTHKGWISPRTHR